MTEAETPAPAQPIEVVYLGQRSTRDGKGASFFITMAKLQSSGTHCADNNASTFEAKKVSHLVVGGVYSSTGSTGDDGKLLTLGLGRLIFVRRLETVETAEWELLDDVARAELRAASQVRKIKADKVVNQELQMVRRLYMMTPSSLRPAFELAILKVIRGGGA